MVADALSQEEIDALLSGAAPSSGDSGGGGFGGSGGAGSPPPPPPEPPPLSDEEMLGLMEYANTVARALQEALTTYLSTDVSIGAGRLARVQIHTLVDTYPRATAVAKFHYTSGLTGQSAILMQEEDALKIGGTMMATPDADQFDENLQSAYQEALSTGFGQAGTTMQKTLGQSVATSPPDISVVDELTDDLESYFGTEPIVIIEYSIFSQDLLDNMFTQIISPELVRACLAFGAPPAAQPAAPPKQAATAPSKPPPTQPVVSAAPAQFEQFESAGAPPAPANLDLLMDIGLEIRVELGRTDMKIRDILSLGSGSVVELNKLAGEPVDLLVNGVIFARGEVVVIDENFGVRITDILSLDDRIKSLGKDQGKMYA